MEPNVITFNALISACEKGKQYARALQQFEEMQRRGLNTKLNFPDASEETCAAEAATPPRVCNAPR